MNFLRSIIALCSGFANYRAYRDLALSTSLKHLLKLIVLLALVLAALASQAWLPAAGPPWRLLLWGVPAALLVAAALGLAG